MKEPSSTGKNVGVVGCETEEDWIYIQDALDMMIGKLMMKFLQSIVIVLIIKKLEKQR